jgi:co-chaperonin GroES (HSP10)
MKYRAYGKWVVVQADPRVKQTPGGIHITDALVQIERTMEGTGRILNMGSRVSNIVQGIEPGQRVAYRGFLKDAHPIDKTEEGADIFIIHADDLLAAIDDEDIRMGFFS